MLSGNKFLRIVLIATSLAAALPTASYAVDTSPGDYTARAPGSNSLRRYYTGITGDKKYSNGKLAPIHPTLKSDFGTVKYAHYAEYGGKTIAMGFIQTCGQIRLGGSLAAIGGANGCRDITVGGTYWEINSPAEQKYWGISPYLVLPTGNYDKNKSLNMGENRWQAGVVSGYIMPLTGKMLFDAVGEIIWHGKNRHYQVNDAIRDQGVTYDMQLHLRYPLSLGSALFASYYHLWGGENSVNGIPQHDRLDNSRFCIGGSKFFSPHDQFRLELGADLKTANGIKENRRINFQYTKLF